jgi:hypothetical protein
MIHKISVNLMISYRCKTCKQSSVKPETTKANTNFPLWHDCANNEWKREPKPEEMREVA